VVAAWSTSGRFNFAVGISRSRDAANSANLSAFWRSPQLKEDEDHEGCRSGANCSLWEISWKSPKDQVWHLAERRELAVNGPSGFTLAAGENRRLFRQPRLSTASNHREKR
jgi:hypothetical protein